ncbi:restriction endonuclease subunit S [Streptococcus mitis]|uniref:Type I restriction modification DNA specificity domain protein n=1 Tax=Streptococcus mitis TaxID=28037 RepID=A0A3R9IQ05_STRMT|nr:restriction endonuclease subunit S [Streptococcus mitis]RSI96753.1 Type I restriction modification DNA specificity domain protein [Streptococcus mitis]
MSEWRKKQLQEIAFLKPTETLKKGDIAPNIPMANIKEFQRDVVKIDYGEFRGGTKFRNGDTLLAKITPCLENGKTAFVNCLQEDEIGFGSTEFIVLRAKENIDERFLYYLSISPEFRKQAISLMEGTSGRKRVNENALKISDFLIPDFEEQRKIANILSAIDDKIQINNQINQELEAMAKTLYDYWFVQFDFPDQNGKPYKSSGGKMVYNPELKREIPEGWGVARLGQLEIATGKRDANFGTENGKYDFWTTANSPIKADEFSFEGKAILIAGNGNFYVNFTDGKFEAYQRTYVIQSEDEKLLIFMYMACLQSVEKLRKGSNGSIIKYITIGDINDISSPFEQDVVDEFVKIYRPLIDLISKNKIQNQELTQLRDWLLPMLMNGQVKVE